MSNWFGSIWPDRAIDSDDEAVVDMEKWLCGTCRGSGRREGVENVSIEDVYGDGLFAGVRPNAGGGCTVDHGEVFSVIRESDVLHIDPTTDSVCKGNIVGAQRWDKTQWR
jgi:hypothetical protein